MQGGYIPYLNLNDYLVQIRSGQLNNQLLDPIEEGGLYQRQQAEAFAIDEVRSLLNSYFYLDFEFRPLLPFNFNKKYYVGDRVVIDFDLWVAGSSEDSIQDGEGNSETGQYAIGDCVIENGLGYCCRNANSDSTFTPANWTLIGNQYDIYFVNNPYPFFQLKPLEQIGIEHNGLYNVGEKVCWIKRLYQCRNASRPLSHQATEQFYEINDIPAPNMFPNYPSTQYTDGNMQWIDKGEFYYKGVLPSYSDLVDVDNDGVDAWSDQYRKYWTLGDNRSSTMKEIIVALSIYELLGRNSFMLQERAIRRDWAYRKLEMIKKGEATTLIPLLQPDQGQGVSWGSSPKIINTF